LQKNNSIPLILTTFAAENRGRLSFQWQGTLNWEALTSNWRTQRNWVI